MKHEKGTDLHLPEIVMRLVRLALCLGLVALTTAASAQSGIAFRGERYVRDFEDLGSETDKFAELTRPGETVETWTRLLTVHWFPKDGGTPQEAAQRLARIAEQRDRGANARLSGNAARSEALVHFVARAPGTKVVEVNVFKYGRAADGRGLVALQFAFRFTAGETEPAAVEADLMAAVEEVRGFDMDRVRASFPAAR